MLALAILLGGMGALAGCGSHSRARAETSARVTTRACNPHVLRGTLPVWARGGFHPPTQHVPHVVGASGKITAILFAYPLRSPPPRDHRNKILWVARVTPNLGADLLISAQRMTGQTKVGSPVERTVKGGPGPSIINLPAAGCWRFSLRWGSASDSVDLAYVANR
ncbi:MAG: hypothetical protein WBQ14_09700 [Gaiellaceae bacterium]